jgi:hypothetical protein
MCGRSRAAGNANGLCKLRHLAGRLRAAVVYSLIGSAKLNGLDLEAYLRELAVLENVIECEEPKGSATSRLKVLVGALRYNSV